MADQWDAFVPADATAPTAAVPNDWSQFHPAPSIAPSLPQYETPGLEQLAHAPYKGSILPISSDTQGNISFDPSAGLLGMGGRMLSSAWEGVKGPGAAYSGEMPILDPSTGQTNPQAINRAVDFAGIASPMSPALRAGAIVPGELARTLGAPSAEQLKAVGGAGYDAARAAGLDIRGDAVANMANEFRTNLQSEHGIIPKTAPKTFAIIDELTAPAQGAFATIPGLEAARRGLSGIAGEGGTEGLAARQGVRRIDDFLGSLSPQDVMAGSSSPEVVAATLRNARGNYAAAQRSNDLTGTLDRANTGILEQAEARSAASNSGHNLDNSIRQRVASLLQKPGEVQGFSNAEIAALNDLVTGSRTQNFLRSTGNMLGGGGGLGRLLAGGAGAALGAHFGGSEGAGIGAMGAASLGSLAKGAENALAQRRLAAVDDLVRQRSPLYQQMQAAGNTTAPALGANSVAQRMLALGLLSPNGQPATGQQAPSLASLLAASAAPF